MRWSFDVAKVAGITVRLHVTFLLLLLWLAVSHYLVGGWPAMVQGLAFILGIFGSVLLHEFGHALAAKRFGIHTPDITLLPIGGVARLERLPERPHEEFIVALAGPAVNVVIIVLLYLGFLATGRLDVLQDFALVGGSFWAQLLFVNMWLVIFNLIPAFPMDGGRVLRALLAARMGFVRATELAASIGQAFAFLFVLLGFFVNPMLIFIGLFVYMGAASEASSAQLRDFADAMPVAAVMLTDVRVLHRETPLADAVEILLRGTQREFPIVDGLGRAVGMLCREDVIKALRQHGPEVPVARVMQTNVPVVGRWETLTRIFTRMMEGQHQAVAVVDVHGHVVGLLTRDNLAEVMMVHGAMAASASVDWRGRTEEP
ncbi:MAG: site-2 protease family protein [Limnochordales bacterium]|nr:MAG: site-2 protease family protein [Bacillota bacterium]